MKSSAASPLLLDCEFLSRDAYTSRLKDAVEKDTLTHIVTLNAEMVVEAQHNQEFRNAVQKAELKIPDGGSMLWARRYLKQCHSGLDPESRHVNVDPGSWAGMTTSLIKFAFSKEQPLTGVDSIFDICEIVEKINGSVYLLGGTERQAQGTLHALQKKYPNLRVTFSRTSPNPSFERRGNSAIFVALGAPKQTLWIERRRKLLETSGIKIAIGVGGAFAMISGELPRAPKILRRFHLEWLWRLMLEPKRIRRIWNAVVVFPNLVHRQYNRNKII